MFCHETLRNACSVGSLSFTLYLPDSMHTVHTVFHVSQLELAIPNTASISQCFMTKHCKKKIEEILFYLQFCLTKKTNIIQPHSHFCHFLCQDMI